MARELRAIPKGPAYPNGQSCLSYLIQLCPVLHCNICAFTAEISPALGKIRVLFTTHCFLPFYYSVICSEKLEKTVLDRVQ